MNRPARSEAERQFPSGRQQPTLQPSSNERRAPGSPCGWFDWLLSCRSVDLFNSSQRAFKRHLGLANPLITNDLRSLYPELAPLDSFPLHLEEKEFARNLFDTGGPCVYMHTMSATTRDMESQENCVCFNLRSVTRAVTQFFDAEMRRHGIRPTQCSILVAGISRESWSMAELSDVLGMDRTTLIRNLRPLQRDGLMLAEAVGQGGRIEVSITALGRKKVQEAHPAWLAAQHAIVETLGKDRWSAIFADLEKAVTALGK